MKQIYLKLLTGTLLLVLFASFGQAKKSKPVANAPDETELIKAAIEKETKAFFEIDYKTWSESWVHAPYAFWSFSDTTDVNSFSGWNNIEKGFSDRFKTSKPSTAKIDRKWHEVKVYGNGAYVRFTQKVNDGIERAPQAEVRVMERVNDAWKIVCVVVIAIEKENNPVQ